MVEKLYQTLGLTSSASINEVKKAYRNLAKEYHPDKNKDGAEKFKEISHAYSILIDPEKRKEYISKEQTENRNHSYSSYGSRDGFTFYSPFDFFSGFRSTYHQRPPNYNIYSTSKITLEDVYNGSTVRMTYQEPIICDDCHGNSKDAKLRRIKTCDKCHGKGTTEERFVNRKMTAPMPCVYCKGRGNMRYFVRCSKCNGKQSISKEMNVKVPKGLHEGHSLQVKDKGKLKPDGKSRGNVIFKITLLPHPIFKRQGDNLHMTVTISLKEAIMGFKNKKLCTHLDGRILTVTQVCGNVIKPNTQRLMKGEGMPLFNSETGARGDLLVTFHVKFPDTIQVPRTREAKAAINELFETEQQKKAKENAIVIDDEDETTSKEQTELPIENGNTNAPITIEDDDIEEEGAASSTNEATLLEEVPQDYHQTNVRKS
ncbi:uncharacterized protein BX663DRAFT_510899 [Cokeromyces recurvatus]|uniref:uncharacterized protein n=1 Tax=Cokeromyces recurvatus TaxID=90255 RepID=UPI002221089F|nr:uncharacterized protein BX663DRAFT_510899 [Cokeromyces recurvatus]KAI7902371.1 hypothetical protein BX663DRAFT_510899 [Cokeromyces recurvatus]